MLERNHTDISNKIKGTIMSLQGVKPFLKYSFSFLLSNKYKGKEVNFKLCCDYLLFGSGNTEGNGDSYISINNSSFELASVEYYDEMEKWIQKVKKNLGWKEATISDILILLKKICFTDSVVKLFGSWDDVIQRNM